MCSHTLAIPSLVTSAPVVDDFTDEADGHHYGGQSSGQANQKRFCPRSGINANVVKRRDKYVRLLNVIQQKPTIIFPITRFVPALCRCRINIIHRISTLVTINSHRNYLRACGCVPVLFRSLPLTFIFATVGVHSFEIYDKPSDSC